LDEVEIVDPGPLPLTRAQGWWAAVAVGLVGILLTVVLPVIARAANAVSVPPDSITFGTASLVPPLAVNQAGGTWHVQEKGGESVTLSKGDVVLRAAVRPATPTLQTHWQPSPGRSLIRACRAPSRAIQLPSRTPRH
jgi:hypothetical protein